MTEIALLMFLAGLLGFVITGISIPGVKRIALKFQVVAQPGGHNSHDQLTPLLGGVAIFLPLILLFGYLLLLVLSPANQADKPDGGQTVSLFLGATWMLILGTIDDRFPIGWKLKFTGECLGVAILLLGGHTIKGITVPFWGPITDIGWIGMPIFAVTVLLITNAINLIDGIDGLAAGICFFAAMTSGVIGWFKGDIFTALVGFSVAGSLLAFLNFNFPPASIFMGDGGSLMLGFLLATLATSSSATAPGIRSGTMGMIIIPLLPFGIALFDVILAIVRRGVSGQELFLPDVDHLHHRLLEKFGQPRRVVILLYGFSALLCAMTLLLVIGPKSDLISFLVILAGLIVLAMVVAVLRMYLKESLPQLLFNRPYFKFLTTYRTFMRQKVGQAKSLEELLSLLESGVKDLNYDYVEVMNHGAIVKYWSHPCRVHPEASRNLLEKDIHGTTFKVRWVVPHHHSEAYQKYLHLIWHQFLDGVAARLQNLTGHPPTYSSRAISKDTKAEGLSHN